MPRVEGTTAVKAADLIQQCADHVAVAIREHTSSWHMLQRVFVDDLDAPAASSRRRRRADLRAAGTADDGTHDVRIGIVCPYSFDVPGGVQFHVRDLAEHLIGQGHDVSVLAPADSETELPDYVTSAGRATAVRYNGSVARLNFGPVTASKVGQWLDAGQFDVLHLHEPVTPSVSVLALMAAEGPIVATFHTSMLRSRTMQTAYPIIRPSLEKIAGRIAVSEDARRTVTTHVGGDAVVIPNGVYVDRFASAQRRSAWMGTPASPTIAFLGRMGEPRKGLPGARGCPARDPPLGPGTPRPRRRAR